jgi:hypothetical protein
MGEFGSGGGLCCGNGLWCDLSANWEMDERLKGGGRRQWEAGC